MGPSAGFAVNNGPVPFLPFSMITPACSSQRSQRPLMLRRSTAMTCTLAGHVHPSESHCIVMLQFIHAATHNHINSGSGVAVLVGTEGQNRPAGSRHPRGRYRPGHRIAGPARRRVAAVQVHDRGLAASVRRRWADWTSTQACPPRTSAGQGRKCRPRGGARSGAGPAFSPLPLPRWRQ